jgi:hypothetical protein
LEEGRGGFGVSRKCPFVGCHCVFENILFTGRAPNVAIQKIEIINSINSTGHFHVTSLVASIYA